MRGSFSNSLSLTHLAVSIAIGLLTVAPASAAAAEPDNSRCLECHEDDDTQGQRPRMNYEQLESSAHGDMACTECHSSIESLPHSGELPPVDCLSCHSHTEDVQGREVQKYSDSVHGRAAATGGEDAASCTDCHGRHDIRGHEDPQSMVYRANIPLTCARCHEDNQVVVRHDIRFEKPYQEYEQSIHGKALLKDGLLQVAAVCTDCHGVHSIQAHTAQRPMASQPETCGQCHIGILNTYSESIHGRIYMEQKNDDAPGCVDCHGEHGIQAPADEEAPTSAANIPKTCASCHADAVRMAEYDVSADKLETYRQSFHGVAQGLGELNAANCASCHGYHAVYPVSDPRSPVHPDKMVETCGKCHENATANFVAGKIHINPEDRSAGTIYWLRQVFIWLIYATIVFLVLYIGFDIYRRNKRKNKNRS